MKKLALLIFLCSAILACNNDPELNDQVLHPGVQKARKFIDCVKKEDRFGAFNLFDNYNQATPGEGESNKFYEAMYKNVQPYISQNKLKPVNKWKVIPSELHAEYGDYKVVFEDILVPFAAEPGSDDDPAFLYFTFEKEQSDDIRGIGVLKKIDCIPAGSYNISHFISKKQDDLLNNRD